MPKYPVAYNGNNRDADLPVRLGMTRRASLTAELARPRAPGPLRPRTTMTSRSGRREMIIS